MTPNLSFDRRTYLAVADVRYGPYEQDVLDFYQARSDAPTPLFVHIHGGGFQSGDKAAVPQVLLEEFLPAGISVAAINYRLSGVAPYPAAMEDSARAIQFLRHQAREWNLDPARVAAGGGSAGAGISCWIGFQPDRADPTSPDPVHRESTRLACIACWQAQCSYDPHFIRRLTGDSAADHVALQRYFRVTPQEFDTPRARRMFHGASPINYLTRNAPPVFIWYKTANVPLGPHVGPNVGIHHPRFGLHLKQEMDRLGVECIIRLREDLEDPNAANEDVEVQHSRALAAFVKRHLRVVPDDGRKAVPR